MLITADWLKFGNKTRTKVMSETTAKNRQIESKLKVVDRLPENDVL